MNRSLTRDVDEELWEAAAVHRDRRTYLDAVDAQRRQIRFKLVSNELLRKGDTRAQKHRMQHLATDLRAQLRTQIDALGRRAFRGQVAIEIDLRAVRSISRLRRRRRSRPISISWRASRTQTTAPSPTCG